MMDTARQDIHARLNTVFQEVFDDDELEITDATTAGDIDDWDSLMHITLVVSVEKEFNTKLNAAEVGKLESVGAMIDLLMGKIN